MISGFQAALATKGKFQFLNPQAQGDKSILHWAVTHG